MKRWFLLLLLSLSLLEATEGGTFINPITDVCWNCVFPIHVAGTNVTPAHSDFTHYSSPFCFCAGVPPKAGIPLAFWEPVALVDVTRTPYQLMAWGGISIGESGIKKKGAVSHVSLSERSSFYHVHYYHFPLLHWLGILTDFPCLDTSDVSIAYLSEMDPFWDDDEWASVLNPEMFLFAHPLAQASCIADCTLSSMNQPKDQLFWCAGCMGSLYPYVGHVAHHVGAIQSSYLLLHRLLGKFHSMGTVTGFMDQNFCEEELLPRIKKSIYKTQLVYPIANTEAPCQPLGKSDLFWGSGKSYPYGGEDFVYLVWKKKHCCLDAVSPLRTAVERVIP